MKCFDWISRHAVNYSGQKNLRCSLDLNLLPIEQVDLIASIAPSTVDVSRLLNYECTNPGSVTGENEQFLLSVSKTLLRRNDIYVISLVFVFTSTVF